jgi:sterol desaturase/sphingolipid hydroxylase (fatty acid hydroxylase superfamily)
MSVTIEMALSLAVPLGWAALWALESRRPARAFVAVAGWGRTGVAFFVVVAVVGSLVPFAWKASGVLGAPVLELAGLGWWGYVPGLLLVTFVGYWLHRAEHKWDVLWRLTHQLHHSALRVDSAGVFVSHPFEVVAKTSVGVIVTIGVLGLDPAVAAAVGTTTALLSAFQHWNIKTPNALGYIVPRPEMHCLHHEYGVHARNYGDLAVWDLLFGTWSNPVDVASLRVGFDAAAARRLGDMLLLRDVNRQRR